MSIKIPICLLMDVAVFMGRTAYCSRWLHGVGAGSDPGVALFADVAVQRLIQVLTVLYRCITCQCSHAFSAQAYESWVPDCVPVFPDQGSILDNHKRARLGLNAGDTQPDTALSHKQKSIEI